MDSFAYTRRTAASTFSSSGKRPRVELRAREASSPRGRGAQVKFWDARTGEVKGRVTEDSRSANVLVQSLAFSPDGKLLAGGRDSGEIDVWETRPADGKNDWRIG